MTDNTTTKIPLWFWFLGIIALFWNLIGITAYLKYTYRTNANLASLSIANQALYTRISIWTNAAFSIAVFGGAIGATALLFRKK